MAFPSLGIFALSAPFGSSPQKSSQRFPNKQFISNILQQQLSEKNEDMPDFPLTREEHSDKREPVMKIGQIRREFETDTGTYVAVKGLSMNFYQSELTSLLGRNGAGKTTLISMLTGLIPPTSGDASIFGNRISTDLSEIRKFLGVCPQHNTIWDKISVRDHLIIYAGIKGVSMKESKILVDNMLQETKLHEKANDWASALSGGQKRRLCKELRLWYILTV